MLGILVSEFLIFCNSAVDHIRDNVSECYFWLIFCFLCLNLLKDLRSEIWIWLCSKLLVTLQVTSGVNPDFTPNGILHRRLLLFKENNCEPGLQPSHRSFFDPFPTIRILSFFDMKYDFSSDHEYDPDHGQGQKALTLKTGAGYGVNYIRYRGACLRFSREVINPSTALRPTMEVDGTSCSSPKQGQEMLTLATFFWNRATLQEIFETVKPRLFQEDNSKLRIYQPDPYGFYWSSVGCGKRRREISTLVLDDNIAERIISDVKRFQESGDWYASKGVPYRRNYLFHGPPGCGKSSMVNAISGELNMGICNFSLSRSMPDDELIELFSWVPKNSVILIEDIDAAFGSRGQIGASTRETSLAYGGNSELTFMGLLNVLDGVASAEEGQIVFMTTNYPERLDPAMIRPGRVDMKIHMGYPTDSQILGLFNKFYPDVERKRLGKKFIKKAKNHKGGKVTMAKLQGLMLVYRNDPAKALKNFEEHFKDFYFN